MLETLGPSFPCGFGYLMCNFDLFTGVYIQLVRRSSLYLGGCGFKSRYAHTTSSHKPHASNVMRAMHPLPMMSAYQTDFFSLAS